MRAGVRDVVTGTTRGLSACRDKRHSLGWGLAARGSSSSGEEAAARRPALTRAGRELNAQRRVPHARIGERFGVKGKQGVVAVTGAARPRLDNGPASPYAQRIDYSYLLT